MIADGKWLDSSAITRIKDAEKQMKVEIISRGINALRKTYSSNKMWVLFVNLPDTDDFEKCN